MASRLTRSVSHQSRNVTPHRLVKNVLNSQTRADSTADRLGSRDRVVSLYTSVATCFPRHDGPRAVPPQVSNASAIRGRDLIDSIMNFCTFRTNRGRRNPNKANRVPPAEG